MHKWLFFTNHARVLTVLALNPGLTVREIASEVGITERATHRIIGELANDGYLTRERVGQRNRYRVHAATALPHPLYAKRTVKDVLDLFGTDSKSNGAPPNGHPEQLHDKRAEAFRVAFEAVPAGIVLADASGGIRAANPAACEILGQTEEELIGRSLPGHALPDCIAGDEEGLKELTSGREYIGEKRYLRADGIAKWVLVHVVATTDPVDGTPLLVGHVTDIEQRKRQDRELEEAEGRFKSAFDDAPIGMALIATDGRLLKVNWALLQMTGYSETALLTGSLQSITHPDDLDTERAYLDEVLAGNRRTYHLESRYHHADGRLIWVSLHVSLVRDASSTPLYLIAHLEDITERKLRVVGARGNSTAKVCV
jgi:PAS domain S-box-containing protein